MLIELAKNFREYFRASIQSNKSIQLKRFQVICMNSNVIDWIKITSEVTTAILGNRPCVCLFDLIDITWKWDVVWFDKLRRHLNEIAGNAAKSWMERPGKSASKQHVLTVASFYPQSGALQRFTFEIQTETQIIRSKSHDFGPQDSTISDSDCYGGLLGYDVHVDPGDGCRPWRW